MRGGEGDLYARPASKPSNYFTFPEKKYRGRSTLQLPGLVFPEEESFLFPHRLPLRPPNFQGPAGLIPFLSFNGGLGKS